MYLPKITKRWQHSIQPKIDLSYNLYNYSTAGSTSRKCKRNRAVSCRVSQDMHHFISHSPWCCGGLRNTAVVESSSSNRENKEVCDNCLSSCSIVYRWQQHSLRSWHCSLAFEIIRKNIVTMRKGVKIRHIVNTFQNGLIIIKKITTESFTHIIVGQIAYSILSFLS